MVQRSLPWAEALARLASEGGRLRESWPIVAFRIVGAVNGSAMQPWAAYFEAQLSEGHGDIEEVFENPRVLQGSMTGIQFFRLVDAWRTREAYNFGKWEFQPPNIEWLQWEPDILVANLWGPLVQEPPPHDGGYRLHRLMGTGAQLEETARVQIQQAAAAFQMAPYQWSQSYLGLTWDSSNLYCLMVFPIAASIEAALDRDRGVVQVSFYFRAPFEPQDFWCQVAQGKWQATVAKRSPVLKQPSSPDGWFSSSVELDYPREAEEINVWAGRQNSTTVFDWHLRLRVSPTVTAESSLMNFLPAWYRLAGKPMGGPLDSVARAATGRTDGHKVESLLEVAIVNACASLGYAVFYAGTALQTTGVDCMAFDLSERSAFALSITIGNDVADKATKWLLVHLEVAGAIGSQWKLRPVVITALRYQSLLQAELSSASEAGVLVLTAEDLTFLSDQTPDVTSFAEALRRDPRLYGAGRFR